MVNVAVKHARYGIIQTARLVAMSRSFENMRLEEKQKAETTTGNMKSAFVCYEDLRTRNACF